MIPKLLLKRIQEKASKLENSRPLPPIIVRKLKEQVAIELTYNSNAIEGNKLTLKETFLVINDGLTVKGKSLKDHLEAKNHYEAIHFLEELIEHDRRQSISEPLIRSLQQLIVRDTERQYAGKYRDGNVLITGSKHSPPDGHEVPILMNEYISWIKQQSKRMHPVLLAALAHHKLVYIHPFADGNGRTARLFMNLLLMQQGYPLVVILKNDRKKYYQALEKADRGNLADFCKLIAQAVERSLNIYLKVISTASSPKEKLIPLKELSKHCAFSGKYLNLLARSGKLEAHKEGRIWLSSRQSLQRYLQTRERKRISKKRE